jgi:hypothetical protein
LSVVISEQKYQLAIRPRRPSDAEVEIPESYRDRRRDGNQLLRLRHGLMAPDGGPGSLLCWPGPVVVR